jgi:hypothetical protein
MTTLRNIVIGILLMISVPSFAEDTHHPAETAPATPPAAEMPGEQQGAMGPGMMSDGMMSGGMMSGGMMSNMMPMMGMMSGGAMSMMGQMMAPERIEGRIAFLKTELKITDAQQSLWNTFADAVRVNARSMADMMREMQGMMMPQQGMAPLALPKRIEAREHMLAGRLDALRQLKAALNPLYAAFDDSQKRTADELLMPGPMGLM